MRAGVITIPSRRAEVEELRALIAPSVDSFEIFEDTAMKGHWFNYARCLEEMLNKARHKEPVLILTDDATTVPNWRQLWQQIHIKAQNNIYVLFNRKRNLLLNLENIARGYVTGCHPRGYYDQATIFINHQGLTKKILNWFDLEGQYHPKVSRRKKHLDVVIQEYLILNGMQWTVSVPSLFDHRLVKSSLGHTVGGSPNYIGTRKK